MSKREAKKDHLLDSGLEVMKNQGYNGTSVKDIVDAAAVPKGSFYNYFESKEAFAIEAIEKIAVDNLQCAAQQLASSSVPPLQRLNDFFAENVDQACGERFRIGCFLGNMCQEMADNSEIIRLKIKHVLLKYTQMIERVLEEAQQQGDISAGKDTKVMAEFVFNAWEGSLMRMKASKCREPLDAFLQMLPTIYRA